MKIWFTSDTHFNSERTLQLSKRPFNSVEEMNSTLIDNWNKNVKENDLVYHLGDVGDFQFINQLNGSIKLITGNYDDISEITKCNKIIDVSFSKSIQCDDILINMVHDPKFRKISLFTLFGHIHKLSMVKRNALNVGVDCHNFTPIDLECVLFYKNAIENHYDESVFCV